MAHDSSHGFHGPRCWVISLLVGVILGLVVAAIAPARYTDHHTAQAPEASLASRDAHAQGTPLPPGEALANGHETFDPLDPAPTRLPAGAIPQAAYAAADHSADDHHDEHGPTPVMPLWLVVPFAVMLISIALMPFINMRIWHHHFPDFAFFLGGGILAYYLSAFNLPYAHGLSYGQYQMSHIALEYYAFIALVGGLYVASGGILVDIRGRGRPALNTAILGIGAVMANIVGTTGASVLLIRPFMRINKGRLKPIHVVFFIFIVSNCGGGLTLIGDPPLYLGFLKGVPAEWTIFNLFNQWLTVNAMLLGIFYVIDTRIPVASLDLDHVGPTRVRVRGASGLIALPLIVAGVFIDPMLRGTALEGKPVGATFQIAVAMLAYAMADRSILRLNEFTFFPVKEVGLLFVGIFVTMAPALAYLSEHGAELGIDSASKYFFATGLLSGFLDNAPTYLNFLQVAFAAEGLELKPAQMHTFLGSVRGTHALAAISTGAVFFGAMTYIGNGPNFMVKSIAEAGGLKMPSFFGYIKYALVFLLPVLVIVWATSIL